MARLTLFNLKKKKAEKIMQKKKGTIINIVMASWPLTKSDRTFGEAIIQVFRRSGVCYIFR